MTKTRPKLLVTRKLPDPVENRISNSYDAVLNLNDELMSRSEICARAAGCGGLLITPTEKCDRALIEALPDGVGMIATFSVGCDHIDIQAGVDRGLVITNTPDVLTDATADIAMLLILGAARGAGWGENMVRTGSWGIWCPTQPVGVDVTGKRLGIFGMGRIGRALAHRARAFNMEIHYHNRSRLGSDLEGAAIFHDTLEGLMAVSDFLSINCASTAQTRGAVDAGLIAQLPDGAIIVNSARGDIVDDDALISALQSGKLAAAGMDVFANEPNIDPRYRDLPNTFLLPHLGSATMETRIAMGMRALDNLDAYFTGKTPGDTVS